jgi:hypothetical protein
MTVGLCPLSEIADIKLGVKTFLNDFFYVDGERIERFEIEQRFLEPVFRTSDAVRDQFEQKSGNTKLSIFLCSTRLDKILGTGAAAYIKWAEKQRHPPKGGQPGLLWQETPAATPAKHVWYQNQAMPPPARIVLLKAFDEYFAPMILDKAIRVDQRYNQVNPRPGVDDELLFGLLCSMWFVMACETLGATAMGQGALEVRTEILRSLPVPDIRNLDATQEGAWRAATTVLLEGPRLTATKSPANPGQRVLDSLVLEALALDPQRLDELYADTLRMGATRRLLAAGRGTMLRERFTSDVDQVAKDVAQQLKPLVGGRRFPHDYLPAGAKTYTVQLGDTPLHIHAEHMMGRRHVVITSAGQTVFEADLPVATSDLLIRAVLAGQRDFPLPEDPTVSEAALVSLELLMSQLDVKLNELGATAGTSAQLPLRDQAEDYLNVPVRALLAEIADVYDADL